MKTSLLSLQVIPVLCLPLAARTWTSSDESKTFDADLRSYDSTTGEVTVIMRHGPSMTFDQTKLSKAAELAGGEGA